MKKNHMKHRDILLCSLVAVLLICVGVNLLVEVLSRSLNLRFDMTDTKLYQLSDTTKDILQSTDQRTQITVCSSQEEFWIVGRELLERYQTLSDRISITYVDPYTQPVIVESYRNQGVDLEQFDILIEQGEQFQVVALDQLYTTDATGEKIQEIRAEQAITSAIYHIGTKESKTVLFTAGHNETPTKALYSVFTDQGFSVKDASIALDGIDTENALVVIANPARDFSKSETDQLQAYFESGGKILVFLGASMQEFPALTSFLERYGMTPEPYVVLDDALYADRNYLNVIGVFSKHKLNEYFLTNQYYPVLPQSRPIAIAQYTEANMAVSGLLYTSESSYRKAFSELSDVTRAETDQAGPFVLSAIAEKQVGNNTAMLMVTGSDYLYADDLMKTPTYANRAYFTKMVEYCMPNAALLNIPSKQLSPDPVVILERHLFAIGVTVFGVAAGVLLLGWVVMSRRRSL